MPERESYLVIGGCGFLGRHIVEQLLARGETEVAVFDIVQRHFDTYVHPCLWVKGGRARLMIRNVTFYIGDITKPDDVRNAINKVCRLSGGRDGALMVVWRYCGYSHRFSRPRTRKRNLRIGQCYRNRERYCYLPRSIHRPQTRLHQFRRSHL